MSDDARSASTHDISELTLKFKDPEPARRLEVFTGSGRRREWLPEEKARIVGESYDAGETVRAVARRYALSRGSCSPGAGPRGCGWRMRGHRRHCLFQQLSPHRNPNRRGSARDRPEAESRPEAGVIELEIDGVAMRVDRGADARTVAE